MTGAARPGPPPETAQFTFWVGSWELTYEGEDGRPRTATNDVRWVCDGWVLEESFVAPEPGGAPPFRGRSLSQYDASAHVWRQTWVDNSGAWLDFTGEFTDGRMSLSRAPERPGGPHEQRMTFYDIGPDTLTWDWVAVEQDGTERLLWRLHYRRRTEASAEGQKNSFGE